MKSKCDCCVSSSKKSSCESEASKIVDKLKSSWQSSYKPTKVQEGCDAVGGRLCWDWAIYFKEDVDSVGESIWSGSFRKFEHRSSNRVHYAVRISINSPQFHACDVSVDDGYFDGTLHHGSFWPNVDDWDESKNDPDPRNSSDLSNPLIPR